MSDDLHHSHVFQCCAGDLWLLGPWIFNPLSLFFRLCVTLGVQEAGQVHAHRTHHATLCSRVTTSSNMSALLSDTKSIRALAVEKSVSLTTIRRAHESVHSCLGSSTRSRTIWLICKMCPCQKTLACRITRVLILRDRSSQVCLGDIDECRHSWWSQALPKSSRPWFEIAVWNAERTAETCLCLIQSCPLYDPILTLLYVLLRYCFRDCLRPIQNTSSFCVSI